MKAKRTLPKTEEPKSGYQGYKAYATFHPASVLMGGFQFEEKIIEDFARFKKRSLNRPAARPPLETARVLGFDTEYDPSGRLLTVGVADAKHAIAIEATEKDFKKKVKRSLRGVKTLVGHSVAGDLDYLVRLGLAREEWLAGKNIKDSLLCARMVDENRGKGGYALEPLLLSEFNSAPWKSATAKKLKASGNAADWTVDERTERCRLDAWATYLLAEHFEGKLNDQQ